MGGDADDLVLASGVDSFDVARGIIDGDPANYFMLDPGDVDRDIVLGDDGEAFFSDLGSLLEIRSINPANGGFDRIVTGNGSDIVFGGSDNDIIVAGGDDDAEDIVLGDNGRATFEGTETFDLESGTLAGTEVAYLGEEFSVLSFNFNASSSSRIVNGVAGTPYAANLPAPRAGNWNNLSGDGPTNFW